MKMLPSGTVAAITAALLWSSAWGSAQTGELTQAGIAPAGVEPAASAAMPETSSPEPGGSQVRIVRLSLVRGGVQVDRNTGRGYEGAFANIPIVAGTRLRTLQGVAEVEFEDNSSLRLATDSELRFDQLSRMVSGETVSSVTVVKGMAYVSLAKTRGNVFTIEDGAARIVLSPGAHIRLNTASPQAELAVFDGDARVQTPAGLSIVPKRQSLIFDPQMQTAAQLVHQTATLPLDEWDSQEVDYHKRAASFTGGGGSNALYGSNDLGYYGQFVNMGGCGSMWRPYFASAAWDPFANGVWAWYPGAGYSWVSPYPWGWLPFHSGSWTNCGAAGWGWRPGGQWYGLRNVALQSVAKHPTPHPIPPAPIKGAPTMVPVNAKPLTFSGANASEGFVFRRDSAGLGVPRETFGRLNSASATAERHGVASATVPSTSATGTTSTVFLPNASRSSSTRGSGGSPMPSSSVSTAGGGHSSAGSSAGASGAGHH